MASKRLFLSLLATVAIFFMGQIASVQASDVSKALVNDGLALLLGDQTPAYGDVVAANNKFKQAVESDSTDKDANLFYAITRLGAFLIENGTTTGLSTGSDLLNLFGVTINHLTPLGDEPVDNWPILYDQYDPPATVPSGETVRAFLAGPLIQAIEGALTNLATVGTGYSRVLSAEETGDQEVEIDDGDVLVVKSGLQLLKAAILIVTAYDLDIDLRELLVLGNAGLVKIQEILDQEPNLLKLRSADGAAQLTAARASLDAGIDSARAAFDFITGETDTQDNDLLYFGSDEEEQEARENLIELTEIQNALDEDRVATFRSTYERWTLSNDNSDQLAVSFSYLSTTPADTLTDLLLQGSSAFGMNNCDFFACSGYMTSASRNGNAVTWNLTTGGPNPYTTVIQGTIDETTIEGSYTTTTPAGTSSTVSFTGTRNEMTIDSQPFNPNAVFGSATQSPLNIRGVLPKFGREDDPVAGTFPAMANGVVLNGIIPGWTNLDIARDMGLRHETRLDGTGTSFFTIPFVPDGAITLDGDATDWQSLSNTMVFEDVTGDEEGINVQGGDIQKVYIARDSQYIYTGIQLADGDPLASLNMNYRVEAKSGYGNTGPSYGDVVNTAIYTLNQSSGNNEWMAIWGFRQGDGDGDVVPEYAGTDVGTGTSFIEWRVPMASDDNDLSGRWLRATTPGDDNPTQIQLDTAILSGSIACSSCAEGGKFFVRALPCPTPIYHCGDDYAETYLDAAGNYSLAGIPIGRQVYLHVLYDADNNGILSFGDTMGVSGPVTLGADGSTLNVTANTPVDDSFIMTKPGVYRVFGATTNPLWQPYNGPWNPNEIYWSNSDLIFLGEFDSTATIDTTKFYKYLLILWNGDRPFYFDAVQDLTAGTAFRTSETGTSAAGGWITSGLANSGDVSWQEPSNFIGPPDNQASVTGDWPGFSLMEMPDDSLGSTTSRQLKVTVNPPFTLEPNVLHAHTTGGFNTWYNLTTYGSGASLPGDIAQITLTGPGISRTYTSAEIAAGVDGIEYNIYDYGKEFFLSLPGTPQVGTYTFSVTIDGVTQSVTDTQHINRTLPVPDMGQFSVDEGAELTSKTPMFAWAPITGTDQVGIDGAPIAYRLQIRNPANNETVAYSNRVYAMTHFTVPAGRLVAGKSYEYRVRASDSDQWLDVQNRSQSAWRAFSMAAALNHGSSPQFKDDWNALTWTTSNGTSLMGSVTVYDPDGIAADGSSHQVSVTLPDGSTSLPLFFDGSIDNQTAYYSTFGIH